MILIALPLLLLAAFGLSWLANELSVLDSPAVTWLGLGLALSFLMWAGAEVWGALSR